MKRLVTGFLMLLCWCGAYYCGEEILAQQGMIRLHLEGKEAGVTGAVLERMTERYHAAAYEESGRVVLLVSELGRETEAAVIASAGDRSLLSDSPPVSGGFGLGEPDECLLSSGAAQELFGSTAVAGLVVAIGTKEWLIRGVLDTNRRMIWLPAAADERLSNIEFQFSGFGDHAEEAKLACFQYGASGEPLVIDYGFYGALVRLCLWLPWLAVLLFVRRIKKWIRKERLAGINSDLLGYGMEVLFWLGVLLFIFQAFRFPSGFIPGKWSDFQFWSLKWQEVSTELEGLFQSAWQRDQILRKQLVLCSGLSGTAVVLLYRLGGGK